LGIFTTSSTDARRVMVIMFQKHKKCSGISIFLAVVLWVNYILILAI